MTINQPADLISEEIDETPFYLRTRSAQTGYARTLEDALEVFTSNDGYRLGITLTLGELRAITNEITDAIEDFGALMDSIARRGRPGWATFTVTVFRDRAGNITRVETDEV